MEKIIKIGDLINFEHLLKDEQYEENDNGFIYYVKDINTLLVEKNKIFPRYRIDELTESLFIEDMKLLEVMHGKYVPIIDRDSKNLLFTEEEFSDYRRKMSGLKEYGTGNYIFSNNLYFEGLDYYLNLIDNNIEDINEKVKPVVEEFKRIMNDENLNVTVGMNTSGDIELIETGSTSRYTNIPSINNNGNWDFDFMVRTDPDKIWIVKNILENKLNASGHIGNTSRYRVRLKGVEIPELEVPLDLDFSLAPQKKKYLSTEEALSERLNNMLIQDGEKYRLVIANIMYAKDLLKKSGVYKPSRGIIDGDRSFGGLGGVGIENWILQHGGSFIDASRDFLEHAEGKNFIDFEREYVIMDFGKNHVSVSKGGFPFDNFVMRNMRYNGFDCMKNVLKKFVDELDNKVSPKSKY